MTLSTNRKKGLKQLLQSSPRDHGIQLSSISGVTSALESVENKAGIFFFLMAFEPSKLLEGRQKAHCVVLFCFRISLPSSSLLKNSIYSFAWLANSLLPSIPFFISLILFPDTWDTVCLSDTTCFPLSYIVELQRFGTLQHYFNSCH